MAYYFPEVVPIESRELKVSFDVTPTINGHDIDFGKVDFGVDELTDGGLILTGQLKHISGQKVTYWTGGALGDAEHSDRPSTFAALRTDANGYFAVVLSRSSWEYRANKPTHIGFLEHDSRLICASVKVPQVKETDTVVDLGIVTISASMLAIKHNTQGFKASVDFEARCGSIDVKATFPQNGAVMFLEPGKYQWEATASQSGALFSPATGNVNIAAKGYTQLVVDFEVRPSVTIELTSKLSGDELLKSSGWMRITDLSNNEIDNLPIGPEGVGAGGDIILAASDDNRICYVEIPGWKADSPLTIQAGAGSYSIDLTPVESGVLEVRVPNMPLALVNQPQYCKLVVRRPGATDLVKTKLIDGIESDRKLDIFTHRLSRPRQITQAPSITLLDIYEAGDYILSFEDGGHFGYKDGQIIEPIAFSIIIGQKTTVELSKIPSPPWEHAASSLDYKVVCDGNKIYTSSLHVRRKDGPEERCRLFLFRELYQSMLDNPIIGWIDGDKFIEVPITPPTSYGSATQVFDLPVRIDISVNAGGKNIAFYATAVKIDEGPDYGRKYSVDEKHKYLPPGIFKIVVEYKGGQHEDTITIARDKICKIDVNADHLLTVRFKYSAGYKRPNGCRKAVWLLHKLDSSPGETRLTVESKMLLTAGRYLAVCQLPDTPTHEFIIDRTLGNQTITLPDPAQIENKYTSLEVEYENPALNIEKIRMYPVVLPALTTKHGAATIINYELTTHDFIEASAGATIKQLPVGLRICVRGECSILVDGQYIHYSLEPIVIDKLEVGMSVKTRWNELIEVDESLRPRCYRYLANQNVLIGWYHLYSKSYGRKWYAPAGRYEVAFLDKQDRVINRESLNFVHGQTTKLTPEQVIIINSKRDPQD